MKPTLSAVICTVSTYADLPRAIALARSLIQVWPGAPQVVVGLVDRETLPRPEHGVANLVVLPISVLEVPNLPWLAARLSANQLCRVLQHYLVRHLLARGHDRVLYLDPDSLFVSSPEPLLDFAPGAELVLVPHALSPPPPDRVLALPILAVLGRCGTINPGVVLARPGPETVRFLDFAIQWAVGLGALPADEGVPGHLNPFDWALVLSEKVVLLRDPRVGIGTWNLYERPMRWAHLDGGARDRWLLEGEPVICVSTRGLSRSELAQDSWSNVLCNPNLQALVSHCETALEATTAGHLQLAYGYDRVGSELLSEALRDELKRVERTALPVWQAWPSDSGPVLEVLLRHQSFHSVLPPALQRVLASRPDLERLDENSELFPVRFLAWCRYNLRRDYPHLGILEHRETMIVDRVALAGLAQAVVVYLPDTSVAVLEGELVDRRGRVAERLKAAWAPAELSARVALGEYFLYAFEPVGAVRALFEQRCDLHAHFPAPLDRDRAAFQSWLTTYGLTEYAIPSRVLAAFAAADPEKSLARVTAGLRTNPSRLAQLREFGFDRGLLRNLLAEAGVDYAFDQLDLALLDWWLSFDTPARREYLRSHVLPLALGTAVRAPRDVVVRAGGVNLFGYFKSPIGLGTASHGLATAFERGGHPVRRVVLPVDTMDADFELRDLEPRFAMKYQRNVVVSYTHMRYRLDEVFPRAWFSERETIGYLAWEQRDFSPSWVESLGLYHRLWGLSHFTAEAIARGTGRPCDVVPCVVDGDAVRRTAAASSRALLGLPQDAFVVGIVADAASSLERKNPAAAVGAVVRAFAGRSDVVAVLKINHGDRPQFAASLVRMSHDLEAAGLAYRVVTDRLPTAAVLGLLGQCDLYLSLHRAEGFGLTIAEAMALGVPVVATGYSGNTDFMTEHNSGLVRWREVVVRRSEGPFHLGTVWADPDVEHAAELCDWVYHHRETARERARLAQRDIAGHASPEVVGRRLQTLLG